MEQNQNKKVFITVIIIVVSLAVIYGLFTKYGDNLTSDNDTSQKAVIENTPIANGVMFAPAGLPADLPIETGNIFESATTKYPEGAVQLSVSYRSSKTVEEKYQEYKEYMTKAGLVYTGEGKESSLKTLFGTSPEANLSVVISEQGGETFVQLAYLVKQAN